MSDVTTKKQDFLCGCRDGVPIALGYLSVAFTFGMMAATQGVPVWASVVISMTNLTSAGQFAGLGLIVAGGSLTEMALTQLVINLRYALMSLSLSQKLDALVTTPQRLVIAFGNTDEIFALASARPGKVRAAYLYGLILVPFLGWSGGTLLGAAAGSLLPEMVISALGIAIYGMFIAILVPAARRMPAVCKVILLAAGLGFAFRFVPGLREVSSGFAIILCTLAAAALGAALFPVDEEGAP